MFRPRVSVWPYRKERRVILISDERTRAYAFGTSYLLATIDLSCLSAVYCAIDDMSAGREGEIAGCMQGRSAACLCSCECDTTNEVHSVSRIAF